MIEKHIMDNLLERCFDTMLEFAEAKRRLAVYDDDPSLEEKEKVFKTAKDAFKKAVKAVLEGEDGDYIHY